MTLQYCSDLHLEFPENKKYLSENPLQPKGDVLLLAGDIVPFAVMDKHADFFNYVSDNFETTYWIPGNHEYYYSDASLRSGVLQENIRSNVHLINNKVVELKEVTLIFSTLWTNISPARQWQIERGMSDFQVIKYKDKVFTAAEYNLMHLESLFFLKESLANVKAEKSVVITHHVPTEFHYPEKYKGSLITEGFVVELFSLIEESGPDVWIYGHHHSNVLDFRIGNTDLTTNQLGYVRHKEHLEYKPFKYIIY
jgi:predicted phosphohydrolase